MWYSLSSNCEGGKKEYVLGAIRTRNRLLRKQVLYPLSYEDFSVRLAILTPFWIWVKVEFKLVLLVSEYVTPFELSDGM